MDCGWMVDHQPSLKFLHTQQTCQLQASLNTWTHHWDLSNYRQTRTRVVLVLWMRLMWDLFFDHCVIIRSVCNDAPSRGVWNLKRRHPLARWPWKRISRNGFFPNKFEKYPQLPQFWSRAPAFEFGRMTKHTFVSSHRRWNVLLARWAGLWRWKERVLLVSSFFLVSASKSMEASGHLSHKTENSRSKRRRAAESGRKITSRRFISGEEGKTLSDHHLVWVSHKAVAIFRACQVKSVLQYL